MTFQIYKGGKAFFPTLCLTPHELHNNSEAAAKLNLEYETESFAPGRTGPVRSVNLDCFAMKRLTAADDVFNLRAIAKSVDHEKLIAQKAEDGRIVLSTWIRTGDYKQAAFF